nr:hypothetical protein HmN_000988100 [Hymenolepis microstoma]
MLRKPWVVRVALERAHAKDGVTVGGVTIGEIEQGDPRRVLSTKELKNDTTQWKKRRAPTVVQRDKEATSQIKLVLIDEMYHVSGVFRRKFEDT